MFVEFYIFVVWFYYDLWLFVVVIVEIFVVDVVVLCEDMVFVCLVGVVVDVEKYIVFEFVVFFEWLFGVVFCSIFFFGFSFVFKFFINIIEEVSGGVDDLCDFLF